MIENRWLSCGRGVSRKSRETEIANAFQGGGERTSPARREIESKRKEKDKEG